MRLPNPDRAVVDLRKLSAYCLSIAHPVGKHKAIVSRNVLGLTENESENLRNALLQAAVREEAIFQRTDRYGDRFKIEFEMTTTVGKAKIRSARIVDHGTDFARLTSCYVV